MHGENEQKCEKYLEIIEGPPNFLHLAKCAFVPSSVPLVELLLNFLKTRKSASI